MELLQDFFTSNYTPCIECCIIYLHLYLSLSLPLPYSTSLNSSLIPSFFIFLLFIILSIRYDGPQAGSSAQRSASMEGTGYSSDDTASEDEGEMWNDRRTSDQGEDEEEDMRKRENELKQELNMATLRCEELKRTMIETKSFIDPLHSGGLLSHRCWD